MIAPELDLTPQDVDKLERLSTALGLSPTEVVRMLINNLFDRHLVPKSNNSNGREL